MTPPEVTRSFRVLLATAGLPSWTALARTAGVGRSTVHRALTGARTPRRAVVERLAGALHVDVSTLDRMLLAARTTEFPS